MVRAENTSNQEEIIVLDETKIDVANSRRFTSGYIDGDRITEVITFKSINENSSFRWILNTYHKDKDTWIPILSRIFNKEVTGYIYSVDIGNFDNDIAQEIIIASWEENFSKIYLFDFDLKQNEFTIREIYELDTCITDLEIDSDGGETFDSI